VHGMVQVHHVGNPGHGLSTADLARSVSRLAAALEASGIRLFGHVGEVQAYDAARHNSGSALEARQQVVVRAPGVIGSSGRVVRKAEVEPA
jgi:hypothetical protein